MLIDFTKFCAAATIRFFVVGFAYTGILFLVYDHAHNAPEFLQSIASGFEIASTLFGLACIVSGFIVVCRFVGRVIATAAFRKLFA